jgi:hypothetical protein
MTWYVCLLIILGHHGDISVYRMFLLESMLCSLVLVNHSLSHTNKNKMTRFKIPGQLLYSQVSSDYHFHINNGSFLLANEKYYNHFKSYTVVTGNFVHCLILHTTINNIDKTCCAELDSVELPSSIVHVGEW